MLVFAAALAAALTAVACASKTGTKTSAIVPPTKKTTTPELVKLQRLIGDLEARGTGKPIKIVDVIAEHIPGFAEKEGKGWPREARVQLLKVKLAGAVRAAFLHLLPKGGKRCSADSEGDERVYALTARKDAAGKERLVVTDLDSRLFYGKKRKLELPTIAKRVPVFHVLYTTEEGCSVNDEEVGEMAEVYHLSGGELQLVGGAAVHLSTSSSVPGSRTDKSADLEWYEGKNPSTAYLAVVARETTTVSPCTGDENDTSAECDDQVSCKRAAQLFKVTPEGFDQVGSIGALKKREPSLAELPPDATASTEKACDAL